MKEFIQGNKSEFETDKPSSDLWNKIDQELSDNTNERVVKMVPVKRMWKMVISSAAAVAIAFLTFNTLNPGGSSLASEDIQKSGFSDVNQLESYYSSQVNDRMERLKIYNIDEDLLEEIAVLKEEFENLKSEAGKGLNQEEILDSMIDNYRLRVRLLEEIMREVQHKSEVKENKHVVQ